MATASQTAQEPVFKRVKNDSYHGDMLDGQKLKGGERIEVQWPDGTVTDFKVARRNDYEACIKLTWHGVRLVLPLMDIPKIKVRRKPTT